MRNIFLTLTESYKYLIKVLHYFDEKMGKFKIGLQLDVKFLEELSKEKTSGVTIQRSKHHVVMHPIHLKNFSGSIKDLLNVGVGKFDKK